MASQSPSEVEGGRSGFIGHEIYLVDQRLAMVDDDIAALTARSEHLGREREMLIAKRRYFIRLQQLAEADPHAKAYYEAIDAAIRP